MKKAPFAVILCKFMDDDSEPYPRKRYEELFTASGSGKWNMVDFFRDISLGNVDISGSEVFGWYPLNKNQSDYTGSGLNEPGRDELLAWGRAAAVANGVDLSPFLSPPMNRIVVITNVGGDLFGKLNGAASNDARDDQGMSNLAPSLLGQEMGHVFGLQHSRVEGSTQPYQDRWDIMSTRTNTMAPHPVFTDRDLLGRPVFRMGPGLNAANMRSQGWLDADRVWVPDGDEYSTTVQLRPLHRRDLPGYLAAEIDGYFFEFRVPEGWDAAIGEPVVLVHAFSDGYSYIQPVGPSGKEGLQAGDTFQKGAVVDLGNGAALRPGRLLQVKVAAIDAKERTATLEVTRQRKSNVPGPGGPNSIFGPEDSDGGIFVLRGTKIVRVPPRSPILPLLQDLLTVHDSESIAHPVARRLVRQDALESLSTRVAAEMQQSLSSLEPATAVRETD